MKGSSQWLAIVPCLVPCAHPLNTPWSSQPWGLGSSLPLVGLTLTRPSKVPLCSDSRVPRPGLTQQVWSCSGNLHPSPPLRTPRSPALGTESTGTESGKLGPRLKSAVSLGSLCSPWGLGVLPSVMGMRTASHMALS